MGRGGVVVIGKVWQSHCNTANPAGSNPLQQDRAIPSLTCSNAATHSTLPCAAAWMRGVMPNTSCAFTFALPTRVSSEVTTRRSFCTCSEHPFPPLSAQHSQRASPLPPSRTSPWLGVQIKPCSPGRKQNPETIEVEEGGGECCAKRASRHEPFERREAAGGVRLRVGKLCCPPSAV